MWVICYNVVEVKEIVGYPCAFFKISLFNFQAVAIDDIACGQEIKPIPVSRISHFTENIRLLVESISQLFVGLIDNHKNGELFFQVINEVDDLFDLHFLYCRRKKFSSGIQVHLPPEPAENPQGCKCVEFCNVS